MGETIPFSKSSKMQYRIATTAASRMAVNNGLEPEVFAARPIVHRLGPVAHIKM